MWVVIMELKECYEAFGGDLKSVMERISDVNLIERFVKKFLSDPSYDNLCKFLAEENYKEAFRAAHSLKGVCFNLGIQKLGESASALTECLRGVETEPEDLEQCSVLYQQVVDDYKVVVEAIGQLG